MTNHPYVAQINDNARKRVSREKLRQLDKETISLRHEIYLEENPLRRRILSIRLTLLSYRARVVLGSLTSR